MKRLADIETHNMDSYTSYRDSGRSPSDRVGWTGRDDRVKEERDTFYRGRSPTGSYHFQSSYLRFGLLPNPNFTPTVAFLHGMDA